MDKQITERIQKFLQTEKPTDADVIDGAKLLLQISPTRYRGLYNSVLRRPQAFLPWVRTDLNKQLGIRRRGLEISQVEQYNRDTVKQVEKTLSVAPENVSPEYTAIPTLGTRGRRSDHDSLPEDVRALWDKNADRWKQLAKYHYQLAQMIVKPGYAPCDGNELCFQLRQIDEAMREDYERYDSWKPSDGEPKKQAPADSVEVFTDNVKTIQNARTAISRGLSRKSQTEDSLMKIQEAVNTLFALKQAIKPETADKLTALGITIPQL